MEAAANDEKLRFKGWENQPTALVAGGTGFIGSYLCEALIAQKFNVICVDSLSSEKSKENIAKLLHFPSFAFWDEDITKAGFTVSPNVGLTHIFHLASIEEYLNSTEISLQTLLVNSLGTKNLLDLAVQKKAKFVLVSSSEVFRAAVSQTAIASYFGTGAHFTNLSFGEAKRFAENLTIEYFKQHDLFSNIVRIQDPYGPGMNLEAGNLLANLINQAIHKEKIEIIGDGLKTLNPTFVTDIIFGLVKVALKANKGDIFALINPEKHTERSVAEHLKRVVGSIDIVYKNKKEFEPILPTLNVATTEETINWSPKTSLDQGLSDTITFFRGKDNKKPAQELPLPKTVPVIQEGYKAVRKGVLRLLIFLASAGLIFWSILLPVGSLAFNANSADRELFAATDLLKEGKTDLAYAKASEAEKSYQKAQTNSENISWLTKLIGLGTNRKQTQNYLFFGENVAAATKIGSQVATNINKASGSNISPQEAQASLRQAESNLLVAKRNLDIASGLKIGESRLLPLLKNNHRQMTSKGNEVKTLIDSLELTIGEDR